MDILNKQIVVIAEKRNITDIIDAYSVELDFSSSDLTEKIIETLSQLGFKVVHYDSPKSFLENITLHKNDIVLATLWGGKHSRNKRSYIAAICEAYDICYVGGDAYVQQLCQDKYLSKLFLKEYSLDIPFGILIEEIEDFYIQKNKITYPCIIKPNDEGCSVGIDDNSIAYDENQAIKTVQSLLQHYSPILIEEYIQGDEISICIVGNEDKIDILEAVQLTYINQGKSNKIWQYRDKRIDSTKNSRKIVTKSIPKIILQNALEIFYGLKKVDLMRIDGKFYNNKFYVIELSPDCSLSEICFISTAFKGKGYDYPNMFKRLIENSYQQYIKDKNN